MSFNSLFYFIVIFLILFIVNLFPYFRQTKKNLVWLVVIFIIISILMINDFGLEFLPLSYLLIYVGAVAVMFLFVIVAVDPKFENQVEWFESSLSLALALHNIITCALYFLFISASPLPFSDINVFLDYKNNLFHSALLGEDLVYCNEYFFDWFKIFVLKSNCFYDDLSLYHLIEYRSKDIYVFSEYFFNFHGFLLVMVGFILTVAMLVSLLIAKDFSIRNYD